jgi:hypothetical protein
MQKIRKYTITFLFIIKNLLFKFPERYYQTDAGVTSLSFSYKRSNLLAVNDNEKFCFNIYIIRLVYSMVIYVYLISIKIIHLRLSIQSIDKNKLISIRLFCFSDYDKKHTNPVWQLAWNERDRSSEIDNIEVLVSISSDGRITQWILRKEFEATGKS